ncbi:MAG: hypothetical protein IT337_18330 [Thermomicrobiales bacterium]|nr:hypothetical protein [Thermomicrobiales bacterium]
MTSCAIQYRLDGPGPSALLVDCGGEFRLVTSGVLDGTMPQTRLLAILAERGCHWVPASGAVRVADAPAATTVRAEAEPSARPT